jgi:hypothetical protein
MGNINKARTNDAGYLLTQDYNDNEIGLGHRYSSFFAETLAASTNTSITTITSDATKSSLLWISVDTDKPGLYEFYENAIVGAGTAMSAINNNRQLNITATSVLVANPAITTVGTFIGSHIIGSTTGGSTKSGGSSNVNKYLMKKSTTYLMRFTTDISTCRVTHGIFWDEQ